MPENLHCSRRFFEKLFEKKQRREEQVKKQAILNDNENLSYLHTLEIKLNRQTIVKSIRLHKQLHIENNHSQSSQ